MDVNVMAKPRPNGVCLILIQGDIGNDTVDVFNTKIEEIIKKPTRNYIMDFAEVRYLDSVGVGAVTEALKRAKSIKGNIKFINLSSMTMELFEMTRLTKVLNIYESEEDALNSYGFASSAR